MLPNFSCTHLNCQQKLSKHGWEISFRQLLLVFKTIWLSTGKWIENLRPFLSVWNGWWEDLKITFRLMMKIRKKSWWREMFGRYLDGPKARSGKIRKNNQFFGRIWVSWIIFNMSCAIVFIYWRGLIISKIWQKI